MIRVVNPGSGSQIRILIFYLSGSKKAPDPESGSATLLDRRTNVNFRQVRLRLLKFYCVLPLFAVSGRNVHLYNVLA